MRPDRKRRAECAAEREANLVAKKDAVEIAYTVEENEYMGNKYVELRLDDFR